MSRMIRFHKFGDADVLQYEEVPTPVPGPGEVLVRVQAVGLGWKDVLWRQNLAAEQAKLPAGTGFELAGSSEINTNPRDTKDYPNGVWTLPPTNQHDKADDAKYQAIGESDRMTLRFIKP